MPPITSTGIGSGLNIEGLVSQLVAAESRPVESRLARKELVLKARLSEFGKLKAAVAVFQTALEKVSKLSTFQQRRAESSDAEAIDVSTTTSAQEGSYSLNVTQLARNHSLATGTFTSVTDAVGTGTLTIRFGTTDYDSGTDTYNSFSLNSNQGIASIIIDSSNNTLEGVRDAINDADTGVSAVIVNDGSGYRLLLGSLQTGAENSLEIDVSDTDGNHLDNQGLSVLAFNSQATNLAQTAAAADAIFTINGLSITSAENSVSDVIAGITLDLKQLTTDPVSLDVTKDVSGVKSSITGFVNAYNQFVSSTDQLSTFNEDTQIGSLLLGDSTLRSTTEGIRRIISSSISNLTGPFSSLAELGITTDSDGLLSIDAERLDDVLADNYDDVVGLFTAFGQIDDNNINYISSKTATEPGNYDLNISQLATQGSLALAGVLPDFSGGGSVAIDNNNDTFSIKVNDIDGGEVSLTLGDYTSGESLAAEIQARINGIKEFDDAGISVLVTYSNVSNSLSITSTRYGSVSKVEVTAVDVNTAATIGLSVVTGTDGVDVAGTFDGIAGTGNGQVLTAVTGNGAEGLALEITGGATGPRASAIFSRGIADQLDTLITDLLAENGLLDTRTDGFNQRIEEIAAERVIHERRMDVVEARYRTQFAALDVLMMQLQTTSSFLTQALANLPKPGSI